MGSCNFVDNSLVDASCVGSLRLAGIEAELSAGSATFVVVRAGEAPRPEVRALCIGQRVLIAFFMGPQPGFFRITGKKYFVLYRSQAINISYSTSQAAWFFRITGKKYFVLYLRWLGEGNFLVQILCGGSVIGASSIQARTPSNTSPALMICPSNTGLGLDRWPQRADGLSLGRR